MCYCRGGIVELGSAIVVETSIVFTSHLRTFDEKVRRVSYSNSHEKRLEGCKIVQAEERHPRISKCTYSWRIIDIHHLVKVTQWNNVRMAVKVIYVNRSKAKTCMCSLARSDCLGSVQCAEHPWEPCKLRDTFRLDTLEAAKLWIGEQPGSRGGFVWGR